jgi:hypothetical protein
MRRFESNSAANSRKAWSDGLIVLDSLAESIRRTTNDLPQLSKGTKVLQM